MGGGDLNMKKHFHPMTAENLEKIWLAEQKYKEEVKKTRQKQKEVEDEKSRQQLIDQAITSGYIKKPQERLEWMYTGNKMNSEDYLLGKAVTADHIEGNVDLDTGELKNKKSEQNEQKRQPRERPKFPVTDLERKIREDPLLLIKKKEISAVTEIMTNASKLRSLNNFSDYKKMLQTPPVTPLRKKSWNAPVVPEAVDKSKSSKKQSVNSDEEKLERMQANGERRSRKRSANKNKTKRKEEELESKIMEKLFKLKNKK